ncbi:MAG: hypothetical protein Q9179_001324 [Wetmoreana sp. 5 TL-2023]
MLALLHLSHRLPWLDRIPAVGEVVPEWLRDLATLADCDVFTIMWSNPFTTRRPNHMYYINRAFYEMPHGNWLIFDTLTGERVEFNVQFLGSLEEQSPVGIGSLDAEFLLRWLQTVIPAPAVTSSQLPNHDGRVPGSSNAVQQRSVAPNQHAIGVLAQASNQSSIQQPSNVMPPPRRPVIQQSNDNMQQSMSRLVVQQPSGLILHPQPHPRVQRLDDLGQQSPIGPTSLPQNFGQVPANNFEAPPYLQLPQHNQPEIPPLTDDYDCGIDLAALGGPSHRPTTGQVNGSAIVNSRALDVANQHSKTQTSNASAPPPAISSKPRQPADDSDDDFQILDSAPPVFQAEQNGRKRKADDPSLFPSSKRVMTVAPQIQRQESRMGGINPQSVVSRETTANARQPVATHNPPTSVSTPSGLNEGRSKEAAAEKAPPRSGSGLSLTERQALREKVGRWKKLPPQEQGRLFAELPEQEREAIKEDVRQAAESRAARRAERRAASSQTVWHKQPSTHAPDTLRGVSTWSGPSGITPGEGGLEEETRMAEWFAGLSSEKQQELLGKHERRTASGVAQRVQNRHPSARLPVTPLNTMEQPRSEVLQPKDPNKSLVVLRDGQRGVGEGVSKPGISQNSLATTTNLSLGLPNARSTNHDPTSHAATSGPVRGGERPPYHQELSTSVVNEIRRMEGKGQYEVQAQAGRKRQRSQEIIDIESEKHRKTAEHPHSVGPRHPSNELEELIGIDMPYSYDGLMFDDGSRSDIPLPQDTPVDLQALMEFNTNDFGFPKGQPHFPELPSCTYAGIQSGVEDIGAQLPSVEQVTATSGPEILMPKGTDTETNHQSQPSPCNPSATATQTSIKGDSASVGKRSRTQFADDADAAEDMEDHPTKRHRSQQVDAESATAMPARDPSDADRKRSEIRKKIAQQKRASSVPGPVTESQGQSNQRTGVKVNGTQEGDNGATQKYHQLSPAKVPTTLPPREQAPPNAGLTEDFPSDIEDIEDLIGDIITYPDREEVNGAGYATPTLSPTPEPPPPPPPTRPPLHRLDRHVRIEPSSPQGYQAPTDAANFFGPPPSQPRRGLSPFSAEMAKLDAHKAREAEDEAARVNFDFEYL